MMGIKNTTASLMSEIPLSPLGCVRLPRKPTPSTGYIQVSIGGRPDQFHRVVYRELVGEIPEDYDIHHLCENKWCLNARHLEAVPKSFNTQIAMELVAWKNKMRRFYETGAWLSRGAYTQRKRR